MSRILLLFFAMLLVGPGLHGAAPSTRDLNHNRRIDPYEDPRRPVSERVADLLAQMTLEEKIGTLLHGSAAPAGGAAGAGYDLAAMEERIARRPVTSFVPRLGLPPRPRARRQDAARDAAGRLPAPAALRRPSPAAAGAPDAAGASRGPVPRPAAPGRGRVSGDLMREYRETGPWPRLAR